MANPLVSPPSSAESPRVLPVDGVPANLPVTVRLTLAQSILSTRRREWIPSAVIAIPAMIVGLVLIAAPPEAGDRRTGVVIVLVFAAFLAYLVLNARRQLGDGFSAGADHTGVYLRPNLDRTRVVFLPWNGVEGVSVRRWRGPQLVVTPRDAGIGNGFALEVTGRWEDRMNAEIAQGRRMKKLGTNIHAPIPGADVAELLNNLRYQAAGRAPVEMPR
jgi:hypothetical protein